MIIRRMRLALLAGSLALPVAAQDVPQDTAGQFAKALKKLSSDDLQEREAGAAELAALPLEALPLIEAELQKPDLESEVRSRLKDSIPVFRMKARRKAAAEKKEAAALWTRQTTLDAYREVGHKDPRWDTMAGEGLTLALLSWEKKATADQGREAYRLLGEAIEAGCDDPIVLYARARMHGTAAEKNVPEGVELHLAAARAMKEKGARYHEVRQGYCFLRAGEVLSQSKKILDEGDQAGVQEWLELALLRLSTGARDPKVPEANLEEYSEALTKTWMTLTHDRKTGFDKVFDALGEARPESMVPLILKGRTYTHYAWDARGNGAGNTITPEGRKLMRERLAIAEEALTAAWNRKPDDPEPATLMLNVVLGQGKPRPVMETWFTRAMEADPDNLDACRHKMYYLEPKWYGTRQDMLAFGRELLARKNWGARLPFRLVEAHLTLAGYVNKRSEYYKNDEVWQDIHAVYEGALKVSPTSTWDRSFYAKLAAWCGHWEEAKAQFDLLGDKADPRAFGSREEMDRLKAEAAEKGK